MDQVKIGRFIKECRNEKNMTQQELADKLMVSYKTISKWECGKGLPEVSLMLPLCEILGINVNELLMGGKINMENKEEKNEQLLLEMAKDINQKNRIIWNSMWIIMWVSMIALFAGIFLVAFLMPEGVWQLVAVIALCVVFLIPCFYALKLEVSVGAYKCKNCGHEIVPTYFEALWAMHRGTTRHLKCPKCNKRTWCKKVIKK